jgi:hypothetical protein
LSPNTALEDVKDKTNKLNKIKNEPKAKPKETDAVSVAEQQLLGFENSSQAEEKRITDMYDAYATQMDVRSQQTMDSIKFIKQAQIRDEKDANEQTKLAYERFGIREGLARYAGQSTQATLNKVEKDGLQRIGDIVNEEASLLLEAQDARENNQFSVFREKMNALEGIRKDKNDTLKTLRDEANAQRVLSQQKIERASRDGAILNLYDQGITDVSSAIALLNYDDEGNLIGDFSAEEISGTLGLVGIAEDKSTDTSGFPATSRLLLAMKPDATIQEMIEFERQWSGAGRAPKTVGGSGSGISNQQIDNERAAFSQFKGEPIVKNFNEVLNKKITVDDIISRGVSGPGDMALVFEFMKSLDPTSVVRETEYESASKSGNIFVGAFARFNGYLRPTGGILPQNVKEEFNALVDIKLNASKRQYDNLKNEYEDVAVRQGLDPRNVVIDYSGALKETSKDELKQGEIKVEEISSGRVGAIPESEFDSAVYRKL